MAKKVNSSTPRRIYAGRGRGIKKTKIILVAAALFVIFLPSFLKYQALLCKNRNLEERIKFLKKENERLEKEKARLEMDISYIELKAREKLGVVRKGEIVIKEAPPKE
ncbi:MAG: septum formation initiator family protein [Candidatus Omnitrophica bacterium]|nr:septum formation initiator family protein [Candidatus Omnitrophota bacterium]MCM8791215.1 septum formation initiator family protein [Candidatus Omnitrophota bacterium]